jgi:hypothetical protein
MTNQIVKALEHGAQKTGLRYYFRVTPWSQTRRYAVSGA